MTAFGVILTAVFTLAVFALPRAIAGWAFVAAVFYITQGQTVDIGINFMAIRFVEVAAFLRVAFRQEFSFRRMSSVDRWLVAFFVCFCAFEFLRTGTVIPYSIALGVDGFLVTFAFRGLLQTPDEVRRFLQGMAFLLVPIAVVMAVESMNGRNLFAVMGGVPEVSLLREGHYRAQASFRTAITAGSMGAVFFPLFMGAAFDRSSRWWAIIGAGASIAILVASRSSGPLMAFVAGIGAWLCWRIRARMRLVRWVIVVSVVALHFAMKAPVWYIFDRMSGLIGGGGWHRSNLIDQFVKHFSEWWLVGMPYLDTADWAATQIPSGGTDVTNYFVSIGIGGGLVTLLVFIVVLVKAFSLVGHGLNELRSRGPKSYLTEALLWGAGAAVFAHTVNILSVTYFDQSYVIWYLHLALASGLAQSVLNVPQTEEQRFEVGEGARPSKLQLGSQGVLL